MPTHRLRRIRELRSTLDEDQFQAISEALELGFSWGQIGKAMGMTRQGARRWYLRHKRKNHPDLLWLTTMPLGELPPLW